MQNDKQINILTKDNKIYYQGPIEGLLIDEEVIKNLSIKYYDNSEPCMIIKSAVLSMVYSDFHAFFEKIGYDTPVIITKLPKRLIEYVKI